MMEATPSPFSERGIVKTKVIRLIVALFVTSTAIATFGGLPATTTENWKVLVDKTKNCQISVPPDWAVDSSSPSEALSPDRKLLVIMEGTDRGQTLSAAKARMEYEMHSSIKIFEDSKKRLWFSYRNYSAPEGSRETVYYVAIPVNRNVCSARIYFDNSKLTVIAKQIAESIGPAKQP
jgi:hypothetical protein